MTPHKAYSSIFLFDLLSEFVKHALIKTSYIPTDGDSGTRNYTTNLKVIEINVILCVILHCSNIKKPNIRLNLSSIRL